MAFPTISVIVPTRDRPEFLLAAVRSVLAQELLPDELLVVDDGAGSGVQEALGPLVGAAPLPIRVLPGPRRGPAAARNRGLAAAAAQLIAFLDDDDLWHPCKLAWQADWLARRPEIGLLGTSCVRASAPPALGLALHARPPRLRRLDLRTLVRANRLALSSVVIRRECLADCGEFDESLSLAQDWDMWLRVSARWPAALLPAPLTLHRLHPGQRSRDQAAMRAWEAEVVRRALARGGPGLPRGLALRRLSWAHCRLGRAWLRRGDMKSAVRELKQALDLFPFHPLIWMSLARCALPNRSLPGAAPP